MMNGKLLKKGKDGETATFNSLFRDDGSRKIKFYKCFDEYGNEVAQTIQVNNKTFVCPDLEVYIYKVQEYELEMRIECKHFDSFPKRLSFNSNQDILIVSKRQFKEYCSLMYTEETPIYIVFTIGKDMCTYKYFWASITDMESNIKYKESEYTWPDGKTEVCYFFRAKDFNSNISEL